MNSRLTPFSNRERHPFQGGAIIGLLGTLLLAGPAAAQLIDDAPEFYGDPGYYPTSEEVDMLGGPYRELYRRGRGGLEIQGPDAGSMTASGIWHQDPEPYDNFYERHSNFFRPFDRALGVLVPQEQLLWESDQQRQDQLYFTADPGFLMTRNFNPDLASMKLGPLYLDLIRASASVLYSDYDGTPALATDDGWLSILSLDFRGAARLTNNLYLTLSGSLYYLPNDGEVGFYLGDGRETFFRLAYEGRIGDWDFVAYNEFQANHRLSDIFNEIEADEIDQAGRYRFGRLDNDLRGTDYFDSDGLYFTNRVGTAFYGSLGSALHASLSLEHVDYWRTLDFDHVRSWDRLRARVHYSGFEWPVIPYFEYQLTAVDDWDTLHHSLWLGARARITQNLRFDGRVGYFFSNGSTRDYDHPLAELGLVHELGPNTTHSFYAGSRQYLVENAEDLFAHYLRYTMNHRFGSRLQGTAYAQFSNLDNLDNPVSDREGWSAAATLDAFISDYTLCRAGVYYDNWNHDLGTVADQERWIYRAQLRQRLLPYLYGRLLYQYEDNETTGANGFDEQLWMLSLDYMF